MQLHVRAVLVRKSPRRIIMRPDGHSHVLYTPVDPEPLGGASPPKQLSAEAASIDSTSTAAATTRVLVIIIIIIIVVSSSRFTVASHRGGGHGSWWPLAVCRNKNLPIQRESMHVAGLPVKRAISTGS
jgi:hypothetical protein